MPATTKQLANGAESGIGDLLESPAPADLFFYCAVAFLAGVFVASFCTDAVLFAAIVATVGGGLLLMTKRRCAVICVFFLFGAVYLNATANLRAARAHLPSSNDEWSGVIVTVPRQNETSQRFELTLLPPDNGNVMVITSFLPAYAYGDVLRGKGEIDPARTNFEEPSVVFPKLAHVAEEEGNPLKAVLFRFKASLLEVLDRSLSRNDAALLGGMTLGGSLDAVPELKRAMQQSGTTHLVALSGYNITIMVLALARGGSYCFRRRTTTLLTLGVIFLFVTMAAFEASILRASIMGALLLFAQLSGRRYSLRNAVAFTAFVMVLLDPFALRGDVGFQLSFLSLLGIVYLLPPLARWLGVELGKEGILTWKLYFLATLAAQLAVLPLLIRYFGSWSVSSLIANTLILGIVPIVMSLGFFMMAAGAVSGALATLIAFPAHLLLWYESSVIEFFARFAIPLPFPEATGYLLFSYYAVLGYIAYRTQQNSLFARPT